MPLSKKENRDRMRVARCATYVQPKVVQPNKAKIEELRDMMNNHKPVQPSDIGIGDDEYVVGVMTGRIHELDADGHQIYDF